VGLGGPTSPHPGEASPGQLAARRYWRGDSRPPRRPVDVWSLRTANLETRSDDDDPVGGNADSPSRHRLLPALGRGASDVPTNLLKLLTVPKADEKVDEGDGRLEGRPRSGADGSTPGPASGTLPLGWPGKLHRYDEKGWRAIFCTTGIEYSPTSATG